MAKPLIPVEAIYDAALDLIDSKGADALSARNLAAELKCSTRTLYQQVGKRDQLITQLVAHYLAGQQLKFDHGNSWQEAIHNWAVTLRTALLAHPNLTQLMTIAHRQPVADYVNELLKALLDYGIEEELSLHACRVITNVTISLSFSEVIAPAEDHRRAPRSDKEIAFESRFRNSDEGIDFHHLQSVFESTIDWLVIGLQSQIKESSQTS